MVFVRLREQYKLMFKLFEKKSCKQFITVFKVNPHLQTQHKLMNS